MHIKENGTKLYEKMVSSTLGFLLHMKTVVIESLSIR